MEENKELLAEYIAGQQELFDFIDTTALAPKKTGSKMSARELFDVEIVSFAMYLIASDGQITEKEADYLKERFGKNLTPGAIAEIIEENDLYSEEFEVTVPACLKIAVELDNQMTDGKGNASEGLILAYRLIGNELLGGYAGGTEEEKKNYSLYIRMLERYRERHLTGSNSGAVSVGKKKKMEMPVVSEPTPIIRNSYLEPDTISQPQFVSNERKKKCPYCFSTNLTTKKKGFGFGKAAVGVIAVGPIGALAGGHKANKLMYVCLNCGREFEITEAF